MAGHTPTPAQIIGALLTGHPEAASLQGEASHRQALAVCSAALVGRLFTEAQAIRSISGWGCCSWSCWAPG